MRLGAYEIDDENRVWIGGHCLTNAENWPCATKDDAIRCVVLYATVNEGWFISANGGACEEPFRIERCDESDFFQSDLDAWLHVARCAHEGSPYHVAALQWLNRHSPKEVDNILKHVEASRKLTA